MMIKTSTPSALSILFVLFAVLLWGWSLAAGGRLVYADDLDDPLQIELWPDGIVPYKFDDGSLGPVAVHPDDQTKIVNQMVRWEQALTIADPSGGGSRQYIDFRPCGRDCRGSYLVIRYNRLYSPNSEVDRCRTNDITLVGKECDCNNMSDPVGLEVRDPDDGSPDGITELHFRRGTCPDDETARWPARPITDTARTNQNANTILHELGHALGLWHEFNRTDADAYLVEQPDDLDGQAFRDAFNTRSIKLMPVLGNYDYDSVMAYKGNQDLLTNPFSRQSAEEKTNTANPLGGYSIDYSISPGVKSRLLQYYAHEHKENWGFFRSLSAPPPPVAGNNDTDVLQRRDPYLAPDVTPVGTPAIAFQSEGHYDIFVRGSDNRLYWKWVRNNLEPARWESLGCCFGSDPAAISRGNNQVDLFAIGALSGKLIRKRYQNEEWGMALYVQGGHPTGGIKQTADGGYLGPAVASRGPDSLDAFVVRVDGRLAVTTLSDGAWSAWRTLGRGYDVTARPAAVALSGTEVGLAINAGDVNLYEPLVTFGQAVSFNLGNSTGTTDRQAPPALTKRDDADHPYRVLMTNADGRISHRFANGSWRDIGGMPKPGTGPSAVAAGPASAYIVMNGADLTGCDATCDDPTAPSANGTYIEPGGLWVRYFK